MKKPLSRSLAPRRSLALSLLLSFSAAQAEPVEVRKTYDKPVLMHYMPWYDTPAFGGAWGYHWTFGTRDPDTIVDGKREIASHHYPIIGPYASRDPDVIDYHLLLMKYAGVDGVLVDWYGEQGGNGDVGSLLRNSNALIERTDEAGLEVGLILEDRFSGSVAQAKANLSYAGRNYFGRENYFRLGGAPLVGVFGPITFESSAEWSEILSGAARELTFLPLWYEADDAGAEADGEYVWVYEDENLGDYYTRMEAYYRERAPYQRWVMGVAYPGFDDFYAEGGAGASYFDIPYDGTATLERTLDLVRRYGNDIDLLQLATWNDFGEGTMFEPTREFGFSFLTTLQRFLGVEYGERELREVLRLYELRKEYANDGARQRLLDEAYEHFVALRVDQAVAKLDEAAGGGASPYPPEPAPPEPVLPGPIDPGRSNGCSPNRPEVRIEAERTCFSAGIRLEATTDDGGGENVGTIDDADYMTYRVDVPSAGRYMIRYRVASLGGGGALRLERAGGLEPGYGTVSLPGTGGWQRWMTVGHMVELPAGEQELALVAARGGFNVNWWSLSAIAP